jgi:hypothetical protein
VHNLIKVGTLLSDDKEEVQLRSIFCSLFGREAFARVRVAETLRFEDCQGVQNLDYLFIKPRHSRSANTGVSLSK